MAAKSAAPTPIKIDVKSLSDTFLSKEQVAEMLHVNVATLWRWAQLKTGPPRLVIGRKVLYSRAAVEMYMAHEQERQSRGSR